MAVEQVEYLYNRSDPWDWGPRFSDGPFGRVFLENLFAGRTPGYIYMIQPHDWSTNADSGTPPVEVNLNNGLMCHRTGGTFTVQGAPNNQPGTVFGGNLAQQSVTIRWNHRMVNFDQTLSQRIRRLAFEARTVGYTAVDRAIAIGFSSISNAALLTGTGLADVHFFGLVKNRDETFFRIVSRRQGQAINTIQTNITPTLTNNVLKFGIYFTRDGNEHGDRLAFTFWINGGGKNLQSYRMPTSGTTFPFDVALAPVVAFYEHSTTATFYWVDRLVCAFEQINI